jgi:hypothetical protein
MSARQKHRGQHGDDAQLFHSRQLPVLNAAVSDFSWLLSRGYAENSSLKLVGDHYRLTKRQRKAVLRAACSDTQRAHRQQIALIPAALQGQTVAIDGYNLLITIEVALSGGIIFQCRDGAYRDIASVHGTYRKVQETMPALKIIGQTLNSLNVASAHWYLDAPVSNSGRLKGFMHEMAQEYGFPWGVELVNNPDRTIVATSEMIPISSDGWVIDHAGRWFNMHRHIVSHMPEAIVILLDGDQPIQ